MREISPKQSIELPEVGQRLSNEQQLKELQLKAKSFLKSTTLSSEQQLFLATIYSFHPHKPFDHQKNTLDQISIEQHFNNPTFCFINEPISVRKCLSSLQSNWLSRYQDFCTEFYQETQIEKICQLLAKIAKKYPSWQDKIFKNILKTFPHHAAQPEQICLYQKLAFSLTEKLLKQVARQSEPSKTEKSVTKVFEKHQKRQSPLRQVLEFEHQVLAKTIDKIAMLDAEVKLRGRKGAAFPSHMHKIQPQPEYLQEQALRFYTDKELKINLMMSELLAYLQMRFDKFDKLQPNCTAVDFVEPLLSIFEERLYKQAKSNFV